jgi:hypothetical protein
MLGPSLGETKTNNMIKQIDNVRVAGVNTMFDELGLEAFFISSPTSAHDLDCLLDVVK